MPSELLKISIQYFIDLLINIFTELDNTNFQTVYRILSIVFIVGFFSYITYGVILYKSLKTVFMENKKPILFMFTNYGLLNLYICVLDKLNISQYLVQLQETELLQMNLFLIMLLIIGFSQLKQIFEIIEKPFHILKITYNRDLEKEKDSVKSYFTEILEEILMTIAMVITITSTINATAKIAILIFFLLFIKNDWKNVFQSCSST